MFSRTYSLSKSRTVLKHCYAMFQKRKDSISADQREVIKKNLYALDEAIVNGRKREASDLAKQLESVADVHFRKSFFEFSYELAFAIIFALVIATLIRQSWFELYEIPTGSMRPTFKEQDHVTVSKTTFGINVPLQTEHFVFEPDLVQRMGVVIFTADGLDIPNTDTSYFWVFPSKKRYIKRLIGKPGDSLYFYGGKIYGVDKDGKPLDELLANTWMGKLEHVPFISFSEMSPPVQIDNETLEFPFNQMHQRVGRILVNKYRKAEGQIFNGKEWTKDDPKALSQPHGQIKTYGDFYGLKNFAKARLLTEAQLDELKIDKGQFEKGVLYLQLLHSPSLNAPDLSNGIVKPAYQSTIIPLQQKHLDKIMDNMYTSRFVVVNGRAKQYDADSSHFYPGSPRFSSVPDGVYEFYYGKANKIHTLGFTSNVPAGSPLYAHTPENVQRLFNYGIDFTTAVDPVGQNLFQYPGRYAYFRDGDLYLMGAPVMTKDDETLTWFNQRELKKALPFRDYGAPLKDGQIDAEFVRTFGITVPDRQYLVLGDNHARSADSRVFGFVPEANLQGTPSLLILPFGDRWGIPNQKPYPLLTPSRLIVWSIVAIVLLIWYAIHRRNLKTRVIKPDFIDENMERSKIQRN